MNPLNLNRVMPAEEVVCSTLQTEHVQTVHGHTEHVQTERVPTVFFR